MSLHDVVVCAAQIFEVTHDRAGFNAVSLAPRLGFKVDALSRSPGAAVILAAPPLAHTLS